jgi:hypothetical protein
MRRPTRRIYSSITLDDYRQLQHEAAARDVSLMACIADCLREYFALRAEMASAVSAPGRPGAPHSGVIHLLVARMEERLAATLEAHAANLHGDHERLESMLERFVQLYLMHTPEVARDHRAGALASANRRYSNYCQAVSERLARDETAGTVTGETTAVMARGIGGDGV